MSRYATITQFAKERRYGASTVRKWIGEGMPIIGTGRSTRIKVSAAEAWLSARRPPQVIRAEALQ